MSGGLKYWFCPNYMPDGTFQHDYAGSSWGRYFADPAMLTDLLPLIDVWHFWPWIPPENQHGFAANLLPQLVSAGVKIDMGGTGPLGASDGVTQANFEITSYFAPMVALGGQMDCITLDGYPVNPMTNGVSQANINSQLIAYMQTVHATYPNCKIGLDVNFPRWPFQGTQAQIPASLNGYDITLTSMVNAVNAAGEKLWWCQCDFPYDYIASPPAGSGNYDWLGVILQLEKLTQSLGLLFGPMLNSQRGGDGAILGFESGGTDALFYADTLAYQSLYKARGGIPDQLILISWFHHPDRLLPSTKPFSFSYLYKALLANA